MTVVTSICLVVLACSALLCVLRVVQGGSIADRVVGLDTLLITAVVGVAVAAARSADGTYLDAVLAVTLVAFIGTTAVARFIERKGAR